MTSTTLPTLSDVRDAASRIAPYVHRTPLLTSRTLNDELGLEAHFKCENFQKVGAFKARGAVNAVLSLDADQAAHGVITHSSGNHGQALAYAAAVRGIPATVVMPDHAPAVKRRAVEGYGARVVVAPHADRETTTAAEARRSGAELIHPYDDPRVVAGQGTAALEIVSDLPGIDAVIAPVGGGGLLSGTAVAVRGLAPRARIFGAEPEAVDDAYRSLVSGRRQPAVARPDTIADGLLTGLGEIPFALLSGAGATVQLVSDAEIVAAARFHMERMKIVVEPSGAAGLAALRRLAPDLRGKTVAVIVSGGNTDFSWL